MRRWVDGWILGRMQEDNDAWKEKWMKARLKTEAQKDGYMNSYDR